MDEERVTRSRSLDAAKGSRWEDIKASPAKPSARLTRSCWRSCRSRAASSAPIFLKAQSEIQDPARLKRLVGLIDSETWLGLPVDVKGNIYEGLLARNAEDVKSGAGQYFTPRPLIEAMVEVVDPEPNQTVHDPPAARPGFLLAAWEHMKQHKKARDRSVYQRSR